MTDAHPSTYGPGQRVRIILSKSLRTKLNSHPIQVTKMDKHYIFISSHFVIMESPNVIRGKKKGSLVIFNTMTPTKNLNFKSLVHLFPCLSWNSKFKKKKKKKKKFTLMCSYWPIKIYILMKPLLPFHKGIRTKWDANIVN